MTSEKKPPFLDAADAVADAHNADVLFINAPIYRPLDAKVLELCRKRRRRKNVVLILLTQEAMLTPHIASRDVCRIRTRSSFYS